MGKIVTKIGIIKLLQQYDFFPTSDKELEFVNFASVMITKGGINLKVSKRIKK